MFPSRATARLAAEWEPRMRVKRSKIRRIAIL
jgi:hypothetical protein